MSRRTSRTANVRATIQILFVCASVLAACGRAGDSGPTTTVVSTESSTTMVTTSSPETGPVPTSVDPTTTTAAVTTMAPPSSSTVPPSPPPDEAEMSALAWGLFCRDLATAGRSYVDAVAYWHAEGRPARMDADRNGIPCQTVYDAAEVTAYWGEPLPTGLTPGPGSGWRPSSREAPVTPACCADNHSGPESPPLPPQDGAFPDDGAFAVHVLRPEGRTDALELEIRRWLPCSGRPDQCSPDPEQGDVYADPDNSVTRIAALGDDLIVVIRPIGRLIDDMWVEDTLEGSGEALGALLGRMDAAVATFAEPAHGAGNDIEREFLRIGAADATFPYGPSPGNEWLVSYRGPEDTDLTPGFYSVFELDEPYSVYGWWWTLEIVDGTPVLFIWAGQIAG